MTRQRRVIIEVLRRLDSHPTADELYGLVRRRIPHVSLGTIYRNLDALAEAGVIRKLELGGTQKRFDGNLEEHHHVRCTGCGNVADVHVETGCDMSYPVLDASGYQITGQKVEFSGLCPECQRKDRSAKNIESIWGREIT
jgi:Fur family ferric uptake transcriptional regulator